jgi:hypothetical protein
VELIQWVTAISQGQPLPPQNLSEEALECRAKRIASDEVRQSKQSAKLAKAKAAKAVPKKPVAMSNNSVAAKRLAALRGQPLPEGDHNYASSPHFIDDSTDDGSFDPFGGSGPASVTNHTAPRAATAPTLFPEAAPRSSFSSFQPSSTPASSAADGFDLFASSAPSASVGFGNFDDAAPSTSAGFDAFDAAPPAKPTKPSRPSFTASGFDNFGDAAPAPKTSTLASGSFDAFAPSTGFEKPSTGVATGTKMLILSPVSSQHALLLPFRHLFFATDPQS